MISTPKFDTPTPLSWTTVLWVISTPKNYTPYSFSVQSVFCCFPMKGFEDGSVWVWFRSGKVQKGDKRCKKVGKGEAS